MYAPDAWDTVSSKMKRVNIRSMSINHGICPKKKKNLYHYYSYHKKKKWGDCPVSSWFIGRSWIRISLPHLHKERRATLSLLISDPHLISFLCLIDCACYYSSIFVKNVKPSKIEQVTIICSHQRFKVVNKFHKYIYIYISK